MIQTIVTKSQIIPPLPLRKMIKCPIESCGRTFSKRSSYSQHVKLCIKKLELESNSDSDSDDSSSSKNNMECESTVQEEEEVQDMSFSSVDTQSNLLSEISIVDYGERLESVDFEAELETDIFEETLFFDKFKNSEDLEIEEDLEKPEFPNEAYKDLMLLVTNHKINNRAGNAIIQFFNKHCALPKSPLPKNIQKGREFMNKMNYPNLTFNKICIKYYSGKEYFLHYQNLINCIKNILEVPGITEGFALSYENSEVQ